MQLDFTRNDMMQEHWNAANHRLRAAFTDLRSFVVCEGFEEVKAGHMRLLETTSPGEEEPRTPKSNAVSFKPSCNTPTESGKLLSLTSMTPTFRSS
jgi:hypothetical protein